MATMARAERKRQRAGKRKRPARRPKIGGGTIDAFLARLPDDTHDKGKAFERVCKWFLQTDPVYRRKLKRVWLWDEWPEARRGRDIGIDLVAETVDGEKWAIQAKAYAEDYPVKKADIDSFLSASAGRKFSHRLLIATTNKIGPNARRTLDDQDKPVGLALLADLRRAEVTWPASPESLRAPPPKRRRPRPHQREAIKATEKGFRKHGRGQLIMACGTGKTLTALWIAEALDAKRVLVLLPSLSLLAQTLREWTAAAKHDFHWLPVCSDETVRDQDAPVSRTSELGFPVTTDPVEITAFLRKRGRRVVFSTYQSSPRIAKAFEKGRLPAFDLAIADEAHRCAGGAESDYATILDENAIKARQRLFLTATPRYFTERVKREAEEDEHEIASMDDQATFGPVFHRLSFDEAIERDLLSDYQVAVVGIDDDTYRKYAQRGRLVLTDAKLKTDARSLASHIALAKAMRKYDLHRVISFHSRVARARSFAQTLPEVIEWMPARAKPQCEVWSDHVHGKMPSGDRDTLINRLRHLQEDERGHLANARCLSEGVDVPTLDGVAFIDPRRSQVDIIQAVGRAIRKAENKKIGTILIPVFIDTEESAEAALDSSEFKPVWDVIKALRAHDDSLAHQLDSLRRQLGRRKAAKPRLPPKIRLDLPVKVGKGFANVLETRLVEQTTTSWEFWFGLLEAFVKREGHARVPKEHVEREAQLGSWVSTQRTKYGKGELSPPRVAQLETVPGWSWDLLADAWEYALGLLQRVAARDGTASLPADHVEEGFLLGRWATYQRVRYKHSKLPQEQVAALARLPGWTWDVLETRWHDAYGRLLSFAKRRKHALVPPHHVEGGFDLGQWVRLQRRAQRLGRLEPEHVRLLEGVRGWEWSPRDLEWDRAFALLRKFIDREGHASPPISHREGRFRLGQWAKIQRRAYHKGSLDEVQAKRLEALPQWRWSPAQEARDRGMTLLLAFVAREGHSQVPTDHVESGYALGRWVVKTRAKHAAGKLPREVRRAVEELPGWTWAARDTRWTQAMGRLRAFAEREGHARVPTEHVEDGFSLGAWVATVRARRMAGRLSKTRIADLESVQGWVWSPKAATWETAFGHLRAFIEREGHSRIPPGYVVHDFDLGQWVSNQRNRYRRGELSAERTRRLEGLKSWVWSPHEADWEYGLSKLRQFVARVHHAQVPARHVVDDVKLGVWVGTQRAAYGRGRLSPDRVAALEAIPEWSWDPFADAWENGLRHLKLFIKREGHARVPQKHTEGDLRLGMWVTNQRAKHRKGELDPDRVQRLEALPEWTWDGRR